MGARTIHPNLQKGGDHDEAAKALGEEDRINPNNATEVRMKNSIQKGILAAVTVLLVLTGQVLVAMASEPVRLKVTATFAEFTALDKGTCDLTALFLRPMAGQPVCIATFGQLYTTSGDMVGTVFVELTAAFFPDGSAVSTDFETWGGTITGHGTGTFTLLEYDAVGKADGTYTSKLRLVDGTGTGDFEGITGRGTSKGNGTAGFNTLTLEFPKQHRDH
jgi:Protein of unknown function (DUF3224)